VQGISAGPAAARHTTLHRLLGIWLNRALWWTFGLPRAANRQAVLRSGSNLYLDQRPAADQEAEYLTGYHMCFPAAVFKEGLRFDEAYSLLGGWAYLEDVDLTYRVWRRLGRQNYVLADALLDHRRSPLARLDEFAQYRLQVVNKYHFWRGNIQPTPAAWLAFGWSNVGWLVWGLRIFLRTGRGQACRGVVAGWQHLLRRRGAAPAGPEFTSGREVIR
jgi:hypothetical protein